MRKALLIIVCIFGLAGCAAESTSTFAPVAHTTPKPTLSAEDGYKASTIPLSVDALIKQGSSVQGKDVHVTGKVLQTPLDTELVGSSGGKVELVLPSDDLPGVHTGDIVEVWGTSEGVTLTPDGVHEPGVTVFYLTDTTPHQ